MEVVQSLIDAHADVNSQDNRKVSCLLAAFRKGHVGVVSVLVQHVTQFPSDKDCQRHIKTVSADKVSNCGFNLYCLDVFLKIRIDSMQVLHQELK